MEAAVTNQKAVSRVHKNGLRLAQNTKLPSEPILDFAIAPILQRLADISDRFVFQNEPIFNCRLAAINHSPTVVSRSKSCSVVPNRA